MKRNRIEEENTKKENERLINENNTLRENLAWHRGYREGVENAIQAFANLSTTDVHFETEKTSTTIIKNKMNNPKEVEVEAKRMEPKNIKLSDLRKWCNRKGFNIEEDK